MSGSNKIHPEEAAILTPTSLAIKTTGDDASSEPTPFAFPKWEPPTELRVSNSDRASFGSRESEDDDLPHNDSATAKWTRTWLAGCLPWISKTETEAQAARSSMSRSKFVVDPHGSFYMQWYIMIVTVSLCVAIFDPYNVAFVNTAGMYPFYNFWAVTDYIATTLLTADIVLKFFVAYKDEKLKCMITDPRAIAWHYFITMFWYDLVTSLPVEPIVAGGLGFTARVTLEEKFVGLLRWLRIGRIYPIFEVFATVQHKQLVHPILLTLARNYTYLFYIVHWMACILVYISLAGGFSEDTWFGREEALLRLSRVDAWANYLYAFYFSLGVFSGFSNEVFYKNNANEAIALCIYFGINVIAQAYILGTITVLLVKSDVESGEYRNAVINLDNYLSDKKLPKSLQAAMREHLELQSYSEKTADENILKHHPSTIKQKVLWHLYQDVLKDCYLLTGCSPQFLTLVLSVARMELFMPNVIITQQGDTAGDLAIIADGFVSVAAPSSAAHDMHGSTASMGGLGMSEHGSMALDVSTPLPPMLAPPSSVQQRDSAMSVGFDLASPSPGKKQRDSAMSVSSFKKETRFGGEGTDTSIIIGDGGTEGKVEDPVVKKNEGIMWSVLKSADSSNGQRDNGQRDSAGGDSSHASFTSVSSRQQSFIHGPSGRAAMLGTSDPLGEVPFLAEGFYTSAARTCSVTRVLLISYADFQRLAESNPRDVSRMFRNLVKRAEKKLREVAKQAMDAGQLAPTSAHTLLHIAEGESLDAVPSIQLAGIKRSLTPGQLIILEQLSEARRLYKEDAKKHQSLRVNACLNAAVSGNTQKLQALLGRGRDVSATDYDKRSALMLACRNNHVDMVEMLLKLGADTSTTDSFGYTALFEAVLKGNDGCIDHMLKHNATLGVEPRILGPHIFQAILSKDLGFLKRLARVGADLDCTDLSGRTPLFLAASEGLLEVATLLVEEANVTVDAVDSWGHTPEGDARLSGHLEVARYLQVKRDGGEPLPTRKGSLAATSAQQAEEPSLEATDESPNRQSVEQSRSSHSYGQLTFGTGSRRLVPKSSGRPSIDQKRQELRRSMRNRAVSGNGAAKSRLSNSGAQRRPMTHAMENKSSADQELPTIPSAQPEGPFCPRQLTPNDAFEEELATIPSASAPSARPAGSPSPRPLTPTAAFEEQLPTIFAARPAGSQIPRLVTPIGAFEDLPAPATISSAQPAGSVSPRPLTPTAFQEQLPTIFAARPPASRSLKFVTPTSAAEEQLPTIPSAQPAGTSSPKPLTPPGAVEGLPGSISLASPRGPPSHPAGPTIPAARPAGSASPRPLTPTAAFEEHLPTVNPTSPTGPSSHPAGPPIPAARPAGSASLRPLTPTAAFEEHLPTINPTSPTGPSSHPAGPPIPAARPAGSPSHPEPRLWSASTLINDPSLGIWSDSRLINAPSLGKPDMLKPPGTSPAGTVTSGGVERPGGEVGVPGSGVGRPGTEQAPAKPKVGSFLAETPEHHEAGGSMVLPFVDPESGQVASGGVGRQGSDPGTEQAQAPAAPKLGGFLAPQAPEVQEAGGSMVQPCVDPESQVQHTPVSPMSKESESVVGSRRDRG